MSRRSLRILTAAAAATCAALIPARQAAADKFSFGLLSDTQWTVSDPENKNTNTIPYDLLQQLNTQFINKNVSMVLSIGDSVDTSSTANLDVRAHAMQPLYNAGIGYYPIRGNHESEVGTSGIEFLNSYPQIGYSVASGSQGATGNAGINNATPASVMNQAPSNSAITLPSKTNANTFSVGTNFSYPTAVNNANLAASYSFDVGNARFIMLDQFDTTGNTNDSTIAQQQSWITQQTQDAKSKGMQIFVLGHKNLLGGNHKDNLFGPQVVSSDPGDGSGVTGLTQTQQTQMTAKQNAESAFIDSLAAANVHYYISGHDHHQYDSIVASPDGSGASVHQIISQSDSSKFYTPANPVSANDTPISQQLNQVGYYIYTVDGPKCTVDYYAASNALTDSQGKAITAGGNPQYTFSKQASWGYSLNGKEFVVAEGAKYTSVKDTAPTDGTTTVQILDGTNGSTSKTNYNKAESKAVDTGWTSRSADTGTLPAGKQLKSDVLTLWGMQEIGASTTDNYVLSLKFNPTDDMTAADIAGARLMYRDGNNNWVNAADGNTGGTETFVNGAYTSGMALGTYGIDTSTNTVWAVVNHASDFGVVATPEPACLGILGLTAVGLLSRRRSRRAAR